MCQGCGCGDVEGYAIDGVPAVSAQVDSDGALHDAATHTHEHDVDHRHLPVHVSLLAKNDRIAERNRGYFMAKGVVVVSIASSPGSGKTALIERTLHDMADTFEAGVIVGDLATDNDARRLARAEAPVAQITTGTVCHLDADMIANSIPRFDLDALDLLIVENVGNLVCPAAYDLGEDARVVLMSVTEGEDKPAKYPTMFQGADAVVITKTDMTDAAHFDRDAALGYIRRVAPDTEILELSSLNGDGMGSWYGFLDRRLKAR
ncbi:hydrogenase nickel incorporation protein HypB [Candidatus Poribacteria bacterium]|jgi:hydrogenase nickel incorporation protein HypB|nr:hydrogenase nickel incorporation protein HypB [Candidatus Poribacteria bacterium]MBT5532582.1 hydrogenase nickel incorporation protein HypB [Candidatus Poribacteria bacterium]MBT5710677.1 hydrogenase nickel incorporation protein HypB [Candidatus Poribacteria bacterium]MBT7101860.1 hydrogenase nickel incorporation protein HypB [Candidatus Poribacteria bacterium]MBT7805057.1 hydrogenase nickel incorporation protein HypB [Candidatus Poribacteria bacterium]